LRGLAPLVDRAAFLLFVFSLCERKNEQQKEDEVRL
jgi:hypothetical protein